MHSLKDTRNPSLIGMPANAVAVVTQPEALCRSGAVVSTAQSFFHDYMELRDMTLVEHRDVFLHSKPQPAC